jgi:hypothetical protein
MLECHLLSIKIWSIQLWIFQSGTAKVCWWIFRCKGTILPKIRFSDFAKFIILTPAYLLFLCEIAFPNVGENIFSPYFCLDLFTQYSCISQGAGGTSAEFPYGICPLIHHFHHQLGQADSKIILLLQHLDAVHGILIPTNSACLS